MSGGGEFLDGTLAHYGVKGMRWGVRKRRDSGGSGAPEEVVIKNRPGQKVETSGGRNLPASDEAKRAAAYRQKAHASTIDSLSNAEMQALITRMRLENDLNKILIERAPQKRSGSKFISDMLQKELQAKMNGKKGPVTGFVDTAMTINNARKGFTYQGKRRKS